MTPLHSFRYARHHCRGGRLLLTLAAVALAACSDQPVDVAGEHFPPLGASVRSDLCIRGAALGVATLEGVIATTDCPKGMGLGYWDADRVRVPFDDSLTFRIESRFDSELELFRIDDLDDFWASRVQVAYDDDSGTSYDARFRVGLRAGAEYLLIISGSDDFQRGPYTVEITH